MENINNAGKQGSTFGQRAIEATRQVVKTGTKVGYEYAKSTLEGAEAIRRKMTQFLQALNSGFMVDIDDLKVEKEPAQELLPGKEKVQ